MSCSDHYTTCQNLESLKRDRSLPIDSQQNLLSKENESEEVSKTYQRKEKRHYVTSLAKKKRKTVCADNAKSFRKFRRVNSPKPFYTAIKSLNSVQKKKVMAIGFGVLLGSNCSGIPLKLGYFVVDKFDPKSMKLRLPNGCIQITVELIHHIYRIPHGGTPVNSLVVNDSTKECYRNWESQFVKDTRPSDVARKIEESEDDDMVFVQNFIILFLNSMVECKSNGSCNTDILDRLDASVNITLIDWCGHIFDCLKMCKQFWKRDAPECYFTGPIVFLILLYLEATSFEKLDTPSNDLAMNFWTVEKMKKREMLEIENGGFGRCEIKNLTEKEVVHEKIDILKSTDSKVDTTIVCLSSEHSKDDDDDDDDVVQNNLPVDTDDFVDEKPESCPQCHRNLLIGDTKCYHALVVAILPREHQDQNGRTDNIQDQVTNDNSQDTSSVFHALSPSLDHQPASLEDPGTSKGLWRGIAVGQPAKEILQAVEDCYPDTFQGLQFIPERYRLSTLEGLHDFIIGFLETSVHALSEDQITSLEAELSFFERMRFNLSWARSRLDMVKNLKFGNDPLRLELVVLEESLKCVHEELVEASARFEKARLDYDRVTDARNKKQHEMAQKFGAEYDGVLNGVLGFGMLPGY